MLPEQRMREHLASLEARGNKRHLLDLQLDGKHLCLGAERYLNLSSNDYLGLSCSELSKTDLEEYWEVKLSHAHGYPSSRLMTGNGEAYELMESQLRALFPEREALVLSCGYMANVGMLPALAQAGDVILADKLIHASLIDGMQLSRAESRRFRHNDVAHLEQLLQQHEGKQIWVVVESVYSMDGDLAPLREIVALKQRYPFALIVDEAHSFGLYGEQGQGLCAQLELLDQVDILMLTMGKAIAGAGSALIVSPLLYDYLVNKMRSLIYTTALPPITLLWNAMVLREMRMGNLDEQRETARSAWARYGTESAILPIPAGSNEKALELSALAKELGCWVTAIRPPTVAENAARLRLSLTAAMDESDFQLIDNLLEQCKKHG